MIDNEPALNVLRKYLGLKAGEAVSNTEQFPLLLTREDGNTVVRAPGILNQDDSIIFPGIMPEGSKIRFAVSPGSEMLNQTKLKLKGFRQLHPDSDAALVFDCDGRLLALGADVEEETRAVADLWNKPSLGFFTFGEFGPFDTGLCDFHQYTLSIVLIREK